MVSTTSKEVWGHFELKEKGYEYLLGGQSTVLP